MTIERQLVATIKPMSTPETPPVTLPPRRHLQFTLRSLFALTTGTAAFFALGRMLGYIDAVVILVVIAVLVGVMEYPRRVHLATGILLTIVAGTLLWANLRPTKWEREFNQLPPIELDAAAKAMFYRGWPLSPCMICPMGPGMQLHASDTGAYAVLVVDAAFCVVVLLAVRVTGAFCCRRLLDKPKIEMPRGPQPHTPSSPPAGSPSGPRVE